MIKLTNNWIIISKDDDSYLHFMSNLTKQGETKTFRLKNGRKITKKLDNTEFFTLGDDGNMFVPIGLLGFFNDIIKNSKITDTRTKEKWDYSDIIENLESYRGILNGITLRDEQLISIRKAIVAKRGILQLPTGSGKTEIMCGIVKSISKMYGKCPTTLILEPTLNLVKSTIDRFDKYNIPVVSYSNNRKIIDNVVNICHPASLGNDLDDDANLLDNVEILIGDESHHFNSEQFRKPTYNMPNLVMSIGVSASAISQEHIGIKEIVRYDAKEIWTFSATGNLLVNIVTGNMIDQNRLAKPILFMMDYHCTEELPNNDVTNWNNVMTIHLESDARNRLVADCAKIFSDNGRKSLILVNTIRWSRKILNILYELGIKAGASYGSGKYEYYNGIDYVSDDSIMNKFSSGEINVLIGTTHLYEGADIPNLDTIILAFSGKGERTQVQGIGRALRLTKNGKYAYIIDFSDADDVVLSNHSSKRLKRYIDNIGIPDYRIHVGVSVDELKEKFKNYEKI